MTMTKQCRKSMKTGNQTQTTLNLESTSQVDNLVWVNLLLELLQPWQIGTIDHAGGSDTLRVIWRIEHFTLGLRNPERNRLLPNLVVVFDGEIESDLIITSVAPLEEPVERVVGLRRVVRPCGAAVEAVRLGTERLDITRDQFDAPALLSGLDRVFLCQLANVLDDLASPSEDGSRVPGGTVQSE